MRARIRDFDWSGTSVGARSAWPPHLAAAIEVVLSSNLPMVLLWGRDAVMLYNDAYVPVAGTRHPGLLGRSIFEGWPEFADFNRRLVDIGLGGGTMSLRDEHAVVLRGGTSEELWFDLNVSPVRDERGEPAGVLLIIVDTTARVRAEQQVRTLNALQGVGDAGDSVAARTHFLSSDHLFSLFVQAPMPIVVLRGAEYVIEMANPLTCQIWGRSHAEVIGRPLFKALPEIEGQGFKELLDGVYRTGVAYVGNEVPAHLDRRGDGTYDTVYFTFVYAPLRNPAGAVDGVFVVASDVTAQVEARHQVQQAQDRLNYALEAAGVGYWDLDLVTRSAMRSLSHDRIFGYPSLLPNWTFEMFLEHVHPDDRQMVTASFRDAMDTGNDWHFECRIHRVDGALRWIAAHGRTEGSTAGKPTRMLGVVLDVTERRELLAREQEARAAADRASRAKDEFLAMLGHELRNPLAPIFTALQLMRLRGDVGAEREREVIARQLDHVRRLVDDLLDVSRIAGGKVELKRERVEIIDAVGKAIETASPLLEHGKHMLRVEVPRAGLAVHGDPVRLAQVVANLLTNAAKYTPAGGHITIRATLEDGEVVLRVRDTGAGIDPEILPSIFDLFVQGRQSLDRSHGGLGLGLTIVRSLVSLHGGSVTAHSEGPGRGAEFVVRLPSWQPDNVQPGHGAESAPPRPGAGTGIRVLVVDDNRDAADMLAQVLVLQGYDARTAADGPTAIRLCGEFTPHIALVDLGLPVMDGYELAERLRASSGMEHLQVVAVTGYGQDADRERTRRAGFVAHLVKPVDLTELATILDGLASRH